MTREPNDQLVAASHGRSGISQFFDHIEVIAAILLAIATVATAWCAYQATRWNGAQSTAFAEAAVNRSEANREFNLAIQMQSIDIELFLHWVDAYAEGDVELMEFYETNLMRPEFLRHLDEWVESSPLTNPEALLHPMAGEHYARELLDDSDRLIAAAEAKFHEAKEANDMGDRYVRATVMFASVLFFAGIASKFRSERIQAGLITLGFLMLIVGGSQIASLPVA
jgi:hypothetical protein